MELWSKFGGAEFGLDAPAGAGNFADNAAGNAAKNYIKLNAPRGGGKIILHQIKEIMTMTGKAKRILSFMIALAMFSAIIMAMGVTALASGTYTIEITSAHDGETYYIYKVFDASYNQTTDRTSYSIDSTSPWYQIIVDGNQNISQMFTLEQVGSTTTYNVSLTNTFTSAEALAAWFRALGVDTSIADITLLASTTQTQTGVSVVDSGTEGLVTVTVDLDEFSLGEGYYLITTTTGALVSITNATPNGSINDKNETPSVDKDIVDGNVTSDSNTAAIGDTVTFQSTVSGFYEATAFSLVDTMTTGLVFQEFTSLMMGDTPLVASVDASFSDGNDYYISEGGTTGATGFTIIFNPNSTTIASATVNSTIVVTYTALVTTDAETYTTMTNETYVKYGNSSESTKSTTKTTTMQFGINKVAGSSKTALDGAEFEIYNEDGTGPLEFVITSYDSSSNPLTYRLAVSGDTSTTTTIVAGDVTITGLDAGTYIIKETKAPDGYNILTYDLYVVLSADSSGTGTTVLYSEGGTTYRSNNGTVLEITNYAGTTIPDTGGIGTTIFYVVGALLMIGAAIVLITRRRMRNN